MTPRSPTVDRIEVFTQWVGFANPPSREAKLVISRTPVGYRRKQHPNGETDDLSFEVIDQLLSAVSRPPERELNYTLVDYTETVIKSHYASVWTDDYPAHLIRMALSGGRSIEIRTDSQHAFMLPLRVRDSASGRNDQTWDPRLSRALASLMPDDYLEKQRLDGHLAMLERDRVEVAEEGERSPAIGSDSAAHRSDTEPTAVESASEAIRRFLQGEESPEEKVEAERSGRHAERLLKQIPLSDVASLLDAGADPSVADSAGQTALMHAAFPPFDHERFWLLVNAGADLEARRHDGLTGLHLACAGGDAGAAAEWVRAGADVNARTVGQATPLMYAASWPAIVHSLLAAGADVNAVDDDGHSALIYAILQNVWIPERLKTIRALITAGVNLNRPDHEGITALGLARRMLAQARIAEEVRRAFDQSDRTPSHLTRSKLRIAEEVVELLESTGAAD